MKYIVKNYSDQILFARFCILLYFKLKFTIKKPNLNYLSSNVLSLYCIFDVQNLVLCLTRELIKFIDYTIMLKSQCKTTFNSVFWISRIQYGAPFKIEPL
jgi:hypothetical protein